MTDDVSRPEEIRRQRSLQAANAALTAIVAAQLMYASFAIGHALGPTPMRRLELVAGIALSFLLGVALSFPFVKRRLENGAKLKARVTEGRRRRKVLVFDDHFLLDQEIVMLDRVQSVEQQEGRLVLRYEDPAHGGRMLRELEGSPSLLDSLERALSRRY